MEMEVETRDLEQIENNLAVDDNAESPALEDSSELVGLFGNGFMW